jgi:putative addiction module component (TIGR02574 family)
MATVPFEEIIGAAMTLPPNTRAMLANHLLESLDAPNQPSLDEQWAAEAERRVQEIVAGQVQTIPAETIFRELRARHDQS